MHKLWPSISGLGDRNVLGHLSCCNSDKVRLGMAALGLLVTVKMHFPNYSDSNWVIISTEKAPIKASGEEL